MSDEKPAESAIGGAAKPVIMVPSSAVRDGAVFVLLDGKAVRRAGQDRAPPAAQGVRIEDGLIGGEDLIVESAGRLERRRQSAPEGMKP